jgi:TetR/AcrR family transcriptional regulator, regulator of cefoperazone and chloramphenicol sensitivity
MAWSRRSLRRWEPSSKTATSLSSCSEENSKLKEPRLNKHLAETEGKLKAATRSYVSPTREEQADNTRRRITESARLLLSEKGYESTTITGIAQEAGVSVKTVYAVFGSKQGVLADLIQRSIYNHEYEKLIIGAFGHRDPARRLRFAAKIARKIYESEPKEPDFFRITGVLSPELALEKEREDQRREAQSELIDSLAAAPGWSLMHERALDILWTLTAREQYRLLVVERGWSPDSYEAWLGDLLIRELLGAATIE